MRNLIILLLFLSSSTFVFGQKIKELRQPSSFFPQEKAKVLMVGSFHFDYPGLDVFKGDDSNKIDVLKEPKKSEVTELVNYIKKFKPTKIALESRPDWKATEQLKRYKNGELRDQRDERYQLGMRIATELKMDTLYSVDQISFDEDLIKVDSAYFENLFKDYDFQSNDKYMEMYKKWIVYEDSIRSKVNLLDYFKHLNTEEYHTFDYGLYLIGDFKLDNNRGADILSIWWYNRNLRIFRKIQEITESADDRILVIFGNGHVSVLRQLFECSPEYEIIEFDSL